ncbi:MAG: type III-B CRISPR module-associated protein Cmr3 [Methanosarcinaceae archaeon]
MIIIEPIDTLFFRDGKPFSMGDQTAAFGIFPPYPSTVYGAIRTGIISQNQGLSSFYAGGMADEIGTIDNSSSASFKLKGVFPYNSKYDHLYFPAPLDLVTEDNETAKRTGIKQDAPFSTNMKIDQYLFPLEIEKATSVKGYYITHTDLISYLHSAMNDFNIYPEITFCKVEYKTGIKIDAQTKKSDEGNLYRVGMRRFEKDFSLACDLEGTPSLRKKGVFKLGGEGKTVRYHTSEFQLPDTRETVIKRIKETGIIKIYFATPVIFEKGWVPDEKIINGPDYKLELITASIGSPVSIGGWDIGKGGHKTMMRGVPAGSVYYFKILNGNVEKIYQDLHYRNISERANEGFGLIMVGGA